jgi:hypothetical protein
MMAHISFLPYVNRSIRATLAGKRGQYTLYEIIDVRESDS